MTKQKSKTIKRVLRYSLLAVVVAALFSPFTSNTNSNPLYDNTVMIVNRAENHGGTGVIIESGKGGSYILTNDHVCKAISTGGVVKSNTATSQIVAYLESQLSDLCLIKIATNLNVNLKVSKTEPKIMDVAIVSGHPALLPTVVTRGQFSDRRLIQVVTGFKPCTEEDAADPKKVLFCTFLGGIPTVKSYESVLVSATIMPGSSGSAVYNSDKELVGLVFAGQGELGYAWTVPYDQVYQFINQEMYRYQMEPVNQEIDLTGKSESSKTSEVVKKCDEVENNKALSVADKTTLKDMCKLIKEDMTWVK